MGISTNSSNIGFRGSEDLGRGLKAVFQLESAINVDSGNGNLGGRNSNLGLEGRFGLIFYGLWDTPYKVISGKADPFYGTTGASFNSMYGSPGFNVSSNGTAAAPSLTALGNNVGNINDAAAFDRRQTNSVQYWTPDLYGFYARFAFSPGEGKTSVAPLGYLGAQEVNPYLWSVSGAYDNGPIYAAIAYEQHNDYFGTRIFTGQPLLTGKSSKDWAGKAVIGLQNLLVGLNVYGIYERLKYSTDGVVAAGQITDLRRDAFGVMGVYRLGNFIFRAGWMRANDPSCSAVAAVCLGTDLGTDQYSVGLAYLLSKRTQVYLFGTKQSNDALARYKLGTNSGPVPNGGTVGIGTHPQAIGLGIRHTF